MFEEAEKFAITFELDLEASISFISHYPILLCFYFWNEGVYRAPISNKLFELLLTRTFISGVLSILLSYRLVTIWYTPNIGIPFLKLSVHWSCSEYLSAIDFMHCTHTSYASSVRGILSVAIREQQK